MIVHAKMSKLVMFDRQTPNYVARAKKGTEMVLNPLTPIEHECHPMSTPTLDRLV